MHLARQWWKVCFFFLWISKSEPMRWNTYRELPLIRHCWKRVLQKTSHNALDKHLDPVRATPKWRIRAFTRKRYHGCKKKKKKKKKVRIWAPPNIPRSPLAWTELNSIYNDVLKPSLTSGKCKNVFWSAPLQLISKHFFYAIYRPPRILKPLRLYASLTFFCVQTIISITLQQ